MVGRLDILHCSPLNPLRATSKIQPISGILNVKLRARSAQLIKAAIMRSLDSAALQTSCPSSDQRRWRLALFCRESWLKPISSCWRGLAARPCSWKSYRLEEQPKDKWTLQDHRHQEMGLLSSSDGHVVSSLEHVNIRSLMRSTKEVYGTPMRKIVLHAGTMSFPMRHVWPSDGAWRARKPALCLQILNKTG